MRFFIRSALILLVICLGTAVTAKPPVPSPSVNPPLNFTLVNETDHPATMYITVFQGDTSAVSIRGELPITKVEVKKEVPAGATVTEQKSITWAADGSFKIVNISGMVWYDGKTFNADCSAVSGMTTITVRALKAAPWVSTVASR